MARRFGAAAGLVVLSACAPDGSPVVEKPLSAPAESRVVVRSDATSRLRGDGDLFGSKHGVVVSLGERLMLLRSGKDAASIPSERDDCGSASHIVFSDRVISHNQACGIWAHRDGDPAKVQIATVERGTGSYGVETFEWRWSGGAVGPRFWLSPWLAVRDGSLVACAAPAPSGAEPRVRSAAIWRLDLDGNAAPVKLATLATSWCNQFIVDDEAGFVVNGTLNAEPGTTIDRIDLETGELRRLALVDHAIDKLVATKEHLYFLVDGEGPDRVYRVAKTGGSVEPTEGTFSKTVVLASDGTSAFLAVEHELIRFDGLSPTTVLTSRLLLAYSFTVGGGEIVWWDTGASGTPLLLAMPSQAARAER